MTKSELIKELGKYPNDIEVRIKSCGNDQIISKVQEKEMLFCHYEEETRTGSYINRKIVLIS